MSFSREKLHFSSGQYPVGLLLAVCVFLFPEMKGQMELAGICFGISAFVRKGGVGVGLGIAAVMYFLNLIANIAETAAFLKFITPFGYSEGADIITNGCLDGARVVTGLMFGAVGVLAAYLKYCRKDIH